MWPWNVQIHLDYIKQLPINDTPEIFGLHNNADITFAQNETMKLMGYLVELQPKTSTGEGLSREEVCNNLKGKFINKMISNFDLCRVITQGS